MRARNLIRNAKIETGKPDTLADKPITNRQIFPLTLQNFGSKANVRRWLFERGSWASDYGVPVDMLKTPEGRQMLGTFLRRLEYGVFQ